MKYFLQILLSMVVIMSIAMTILYLISIPRCVDVPLSYKDVIPCRGSYERF